MFATLASSSCMYSERDSILATANNRDHAGRPARSGLRLLPAESLLCLTGNLAGARLPGPLSNHLYYGDNLDLLRGFPDEFVDLIYLDPPWNPKADYNVIFRDESGRQSRAQRDAFDGTWHWGPTAEDHYGYLTQTARNHGNVPAPVSTLIAALRSTLGTNQILAYVVEMTVRLVELRRVLKPTGSLYLHSDPTASHYLKVVLDALFGANRFVNEITWRRTGAHSSAGRYGPNYDTILFYAKGPKWTWNRLYGPYSERYVDENYRNVDENGRLWRRDNLTAPGARPGTRVDYEWQGRQPARGRHWAVPVERLDDWNAEGRIVYSSKGYPQYKRYLDEMPGVPLQAFWDDVPVVNNRSKEFLGWQTQKPVALLQRIIAASSNPGDLVLDPFCGCGTALDAAEGLGRKWIGIDITWWSIAVMKARLRTGFGIEAQVEGAPTEVEGARQLARQKPNGRDQFEAWALTLVGAIPHGGPQKKGADQGADGVITFSGQAGVLESAIVSVKSGHVEAGDIQKLKGAMQRHGGSMGLFVTLEKPSGPMRHEAATAGQYHSDVSDKEYQRVQILSIRELIEDGRKPDLPPLLATEYRGTLWSADEVPVIPRRRVPRRKPATKPSGQRKGPVPTNDLVGTLREEYAASRSAPQPPQGSTRDRTALPSTRKD